MTRSLGIAGIIKKHPAPRLRHLPHIANTPISSVMTANDVPIYVDVHLWDHGSDHEKAVMALKKKFPDFFVSFDAFGDNHGRGFGLLHRRKTFRRIELQEPLLIHGCGTMLRDTKIDAVSGTAESPYFVIDFRYQTNGLRFTKRMTTVFDARRKMPIYYSPTIEGDALQAILRCVERIESNR